MATTNLPETAAHPACQLCYLDAAHVGGVLADFEGVEVLDRESRKIGSFEGVVVDPAEQRAVYLVVDTGHPLHSHRVLVPLTEIRVDADRRALLLDDEQPDHYREFTPRAA